MTTITQSKASGVGLVMPAIAAVLAVAAGAIHLAHNYLPMQAPSSGGAEPPHIAPAAGGAGGASGLMSLVGPHLSEVMLLNFVGFVGLALVLVLVARTRPALRLLVDGLLALMSVATLYAWNAMGRSNPYGTGTLALVVELALMMVALADAALFTLRRAQPSRARVLTA